MVLGKESGGGKGSSSTSSFSTRPSSYTDCPQILAPSPVPGDPIAALQGFILSYSRYGTAVQLPKCLFASEEVQPVAARLRTPWTFPPASLHEKQRNVCEHSSKALRHERLKKGCPAIAAQPLLEIRATRHLLPSNQCAVDKRASGAGGGMAWLRVKSNIPPDPNSVSPVEYLIRSVKIIWPFFLVKGKAQSGRKVLYWYALT